MPSSSDVADKAVSTEDAIASGCGGAGPVEMARLEAVLAALVENKVEAMKHDSALEAAALRAKRRRRAGSVPVSPTTGRNRSRLTSSSTLSSDQHHHHHHGKHHHHHHHQHHPHGDKRGRRHRHRRHDSAPCGDYIEDPHKHRHGGREKSQSVDSPGRHHHNRRRHSRPPHHPHPHHRPPNPAATLPPPPAHERGETIVSETTRGDPRFELLGISDADLAAIKLEHLQQSRQALSDTHEYTTAAAARIHQSACYISHSAAQLKSHYDEDDYLTLQYADEIDDDEDDSLSLDVDLEAARASVIDTEVRGAANNSEQRPPTGRRPPRRKRKRRKRRRTIVDVEGIELEMEDPDDLPPRARWTIVATACLLLVMSLLLVGVTLRMAPIIDEMVDTRANVWPTMPYIVGSPIDLYPEIEQRKYFDRHTAYTLLRITNIHISACERGSKAFHERSQTRQSRQEADIRAPGVDVLIPGAPRLQLREKCMYEIVKLQKIKKKLRFYDDVDDVDDDRKDERSSGIASGSPAAAAAGAYIAQRVSGSFAATLFNSPRSLQQYSAKRSARGMCLEPNKVGQQPP
ncbi:unnamed protein product [Trichogramma brassicae]|uniref:Uncharacterized protein n=1 Tax=Trichogramma brassicae TaxID=86971 RepID=A0A6H5J0S6_9HYME|nr:unnamed protein product [Trichogramma brassicae]